MTTRRSRAVLVSFTAIVVTVLDLSSGMTAASAGTAAGGVTTAARLTQPVVNTSVVYRFSPSPIAPSGQLAPNARVTVTVSAENGLNVGIPSAVLFLSARSGALGIAAVGNTTLTTRPMPFTTSARGSILVVYTAPAKRPATGQDAIVVQDLASSPTQVNTDSYAFSSATPTISVGDVNVVESDQHPAVPAIFTVTLSSAEASAVTVRYTLICGVGDEPCSGDDYPPMPSPGTATIAAGRASTTITVMQFSYVGASGRETYNEGWYVKLENPAGAVLGRAVGAGLLLPDVENGIQRVADLYVGNASAVPTLSAAGVPLSVTVTLGAVEPGPVTFHYATANGSAEAGVDYVAVSGTGTIPAGATSVVLRVEVLPGRPPTSDETFTLTISNATGGPPIARATGTDAVLTA